MHHGSDIGGGRKMDFRKNFNGIVTKCFCFVGIIQSVLYEFHNAIPLDIFLVSHCLLLVPDLTAEIAVQIMLVDVYLAVHFLIRQTVRDVACHYVAIHVVLVLYLVSVLVHSSANRDLLKRYGSCLLIS
jgi:hypothetical protein